ncbi:hypothetical protein Hanom_Chr07g00613981 [Helianthus anomalus]
MTNWVFLLMTDHFFSGLASPFRIRATNRPNSCTINASWGRSVAILNSLGSGIHPSDKSAHLEFATA